MSFLVMQRTSTRAFWTAASRASPLLVGRPRSLPVSGRPPTTELATTTLGMPNSSHSFQAVVPPAAAPSKPPTFTDLDNDGIDDDRQKVHRPRRQFEPDELHDLPHDFAHLSNELLFHLAKNGIHGACRERLIREIMRADNVDWDTAFQKVQEMNRVNDQFAWAVTAPYKVGFVCGIGAALTAVPLVFHKPTVLWFNEMFVHEGLPDGGAEALDNMWKVGAFSWGFMEPYIGTLSFMLLGFQFARAQMQKMGHKPYYEALLSYRARRLAKLYRKYEREVVKDFSRSDPWDS